MKEGELVFDVVGVFQHFLAPVLKNFFALVTDAQGQVFVKQFLTLVVYNSDVSQPQKGRHDTQHNNK
jgi:hypothetical protein